MNLRNVKRNHIAGALLAMSIAGLSLGQALLQNKAEAQRDTVQAPVFEVDPLWPRPLPNHWSLGWTVGLWVDAQDNVWGIHCGAGGLHNNERGLELNPPIAECCRTAPPVLVFDPAGNLLRSWGGPGAGYAWPQGAHGVHVDSKGNRYTTETCEGERVQKFVYKGVGPVPRGSQGVLWPKR